MKNKKIIGIIIAANFAVGIAAFAQDAAQPDATKSDINQPATAQPDAAQPSSPDSSIQSPPALPGANEPAGAATKTFDKEMFLKDCAKNGMAEVNMSQIGTQKAQDPALKEVAQKLVTDHSKLNDEVKELAKEKDITLSTEMDPKHQKMMDHLSGLSGAEFDKAFATHMVQGHKKSIAKFKQAAANTEDTEISEFAKKTLPTLQEHLTAIQKWAPDATADTGASVDEPAGAEKDELKDDSKNSAPDYKSPSDDQDKSDLPK